MAGLVAVENEVVMGRGGQKAGVGWVGYDDCYVMSDA